MSLGAREGCSNPCLSDRHLYCESQKTRREDQLIAQVQGSERGVIATDDEYVAPGPQAFVSHRCAIPRSPNRPGPPAGRPARRPGIRSHVASRRATSRNRSAERDASIKAVCLLWSWWTFTRRRRPRPAGVSSLFRAFLIQALVIGRSRGALVDRSELSNTLRDERGISGDGLRRNRSRSTPQGSSTGFNDESPEVLPLGAREDARSKVHVPLTQVSRSGREMWGTRGGRRAAHVRAVPPVPLLPSLIRCGSQRPRGDP